MKDITDDLNGTPPSSNMAASKQNHQAGLEKAGSECKVIQNFCDHGMINDFFFSSELG